MSSRYYNDDGYNIASSPYSTYRARPRVRSTKAQPTHLSYYYVKSGPKTSHTSATSPLTKPKKSRHTSDSMYLPLSSRKRPVGQWKPRKPKTKKTTSKTPDEDDDNGVAKTTKLGEFNQEAIEAELNPYKKGVYYHDEEQELNANTVPVSPAAGMVSTKSKLNGHIKPSSPTSPSPSHDHYHYQLTRTRPRAAYNAPPPPLPPRIDPASIYGALPRPVPPNYEERMNASKSKKKESKKSSSPSAKSSSKRKSKSSKSSSGRNRTRSSKKRNTTVTISPARYSNDYLYSGVAGTTNNSALPAVLPMYGYDDLYNYGYPYSSYTYPNATTTTAAAAAAQYGYNYGYGYGYGTSTVPALPAMAMGPYGGYVRATDRGYIHDDGSWYPYPDILTQVANNNGTTTTTSGVKDKRTKKEKKKDKDKKEKDGSDEVASGDKVQTSKLVHSANVNLSTPLNEATIVKKMTPGRRVNKIQKQLEYYFSAQNMATDDYLRELMDEEGWVDIEKIISFNRMHVLGADHALVVQAAYHSQLIEIDAKNENKIRMMNTWQQFVMKPNNTRSNNDGTEVTAQTIEDIVASIERQHRRQKRKEQKKKEKAKKEQEKEENKEVEKEKKEDNDNENENENKNENGNADCDTNNKENKKKNNPQVEELKQQQQDKKDKNGKTEEDDMVEID